MQYTASGPEWANAILRPTTLHEFAALVERVAGIVLSDEKISLVQSRLTRRLRATRINNFEAYLELVRSDLGGEEFHNMLRCLTTNVTKFNREPHHFTDLREIVLPRLGGKLESGGKVRIWSSACSTGEEPYSIAMELCEFFPRIESLDVKILATDIDASVVSKAKSAEYESSEIDKLPDPLKKYFDYSKIKNGMKASSKISKLIRFKTLNLLDEWPFKGHFDVIFCRNVMIYFNKDTQDRVLCKLINVSQKGTRLYIGHSERLVGEAQQKFRNVGTTTFERV